MKYFIIEYFQESMNKWTRHTFIDYNTFEEAKKEVDSYIDHDLGIKFRIMKVEEVFESK